MRYRQSMRAVALWILIGCSWGCFSYQRTAPAALRPGEQSVSVTFREWRTMARGDAPGTVTLAGVYGPLERVSGDTLFVRLAGGLNERRQPVRLAASDSSIAIAVADAEWVEAYRFSGWSTAVGGLVTLGVAFLMLLASCGEFCS